MTEPAAAGPLVLIAVNGVLNARPGPDRLVRLLAEGWQVTQVTNSNGTWPIVYNPGHGKLLTGLAAATGAQLAWGTSWEQDANELIAPLAGLPSLPVAPVRGHPGKAHGAVPWTAGRPFVWFARDYEVAAAVTELAVQPHKVILVNRVGGLTTTHIAQAREWLLGHRPCNGRPGADAAAAAIMTGGDGTGVFRAGPGQARRPGERDYRGHDGG